MQLNTPAKFRGQLTLVAAGLMLLISTGCSTGSVRQLFGPGPLFGRTARPTAPQQETGDPGKGIALFRSLKRSQSDADQKDTDSGSMPSAHPAASENPFGEGNLSADPFLISDADNAVRSAAAESSAAAVTEQFTAEITPGALNAAHHENEHQQHLAQLDAMLLASQAGRVSSGRSRSTEQTASADGKAFNAVADRSHSDAFDSMLGLFENQKTASSRADGDTRGRSGADNAVAWSGWEQVDRAGGMKTIQQTAAAAQTDEEIPDLTTLEDLLGGSDTVPDLQVDTSVALAPSTPVPPVPSATPGNSIPQMADLPESPAPKMPPAIPQVPEHIVAQDALSAESDSIAIPAELPLTESTSWADEEVLVSTPPASLPGMSEWLSSVATENSVAEKPAASSGRRASLSANRVRVLPGSDPVVQPAAPQYRPQATEVDMIRSVVYSPGRSAQAADTGQLLPDSMPVSMNVSPRHLETDPGAFSEAISRKTWGLIAVSGVILMLLYLPGSADRLQRRL